MGEPAAAEPLRDDDLAADRGVSLAEDEGPEQVLRDRAQSIGEEEILAGEARASADRRKDRIGLHALDVSRLRSRRTAEVGELHQDGEIVRGQFEGVVAVRVGVSEGITRGAPTKDVAMDGAIVVSE